MHEEINLGGRDKRWFMRVGGIFGYWHLSVLSEVLLTPKKGKGAVVAYKRWEEMKQTYFSFEKWLWKSLKVFEKEKY